MEYYRDLIFCFSPIGEYLKNIASKVNPDWLIPVVITSGSVPVVITSGSGKWNTKLDTGEKIGKL